MAWKVEFSPIAARELKKLDPQIAKRLLAFLHERLSIIDDPRSLGQALKGARLGDFWKYRIGDYRMIVQIEDGKLVILVLRVGNRREVYRE